MQSLRELYKIGNGPSSSHTIGPKRAALYYLDKFPSASRYEVILYGSLALTGKGHLTDKIIYDTFKDKKINVVFDINEIPTFHPNMMDFLAYDEENLINRTRIYSVGGGTILIDGEKLKQNQDVYKENDLAEIMEYCTKKGIRLCDYVYENEPDIKPFLSKIYDVMLESVVVGLSKEGTLPGKLNVTRKAKQLYKQSKKHKSLIISAYAYAVSEENASGGEIVTAPTCGASGVMPALLAHLLDIGISKEKIIDGIATAGIIGNVIKHNASISGAECGCQAEIGSATAMASAMMCEAFGCSMEQIEHASEIAMEHFLGLTCDPVDGYVQIPCIERNAVAAMHALHAATLAQVINETQKISFDLVVKTMKETGKDLNKIYRETSEGGLAKMYHK